MGGIRTQLFTGYIHDTGWDIDGYRLKLYKTEAFPDDYFLYGWFESADEAVMRTLFETETEAGLCLYDSLEEFQKAWEAGDYEPQGCFCIPAEKVSHLLPIRKFQITLTADTEDTFDFIKKDLEQELNCCCTSFDVEHMKVEELTDQWVVVKEV